MKKIPTRGDLQHRLRSEGRGATSQSSQPRSGPRYEDWSKQELYERAREIGIEGRSTMDKAQLIESLRNH